MRVACKSRPRRTDYLAIADAAREYATNPKPAYLRIQIAEAEQRFIGAVLVLELEKLNEQLVLLNQTLPRIAVRV